MSRMRHALTPEAHERFLPVMLFVGAALFYGVIVPLVVLFLAA